VLALQSKAIAALTLSPQTADEIAARIGAEDQQETIYLLLEHLAANGRAHINSDGRPAQAKFSKL
jgi:glucose-6-phosphate isomerase